MVFLSYLHFFSSWELQLEHMVPPESWHMPVSPWRVLFWCLLQKLIIRTVASSKENVIPSVRIKVVIT